jgi:hypothetical protein
MHHGNQVVHMFAHWLCREADVQQHHASL